MEHRTALGYAAVPSEPALEKKTASQRCAIGGSCAALGSIQAAPPHVFAHGVELLFSRELGVAGVPQLAV